MASKSQQPADPESVVTPEHVYYCFDTLVAYLNHHAQPKPAFANPDAQSPIFVTWDTVVGTERELRGCIGTFSDPPLGKGLASYALTSALRDTRFPPIRESELPSLECTVSLLTDFEDCKDWQDWEVGVHGIYIYVPSSSGTLTATFLPDVMPEQGWDHQDAVDHAIRKAGYRGRVSAELRNKCRVERYRSERITRSYQQYLDWKKTAASPA